MIDHTIPVTDLHRHLDGNIRPETIFELAQQFNIALPASDLESLRPHIQVLGKEPDLLKFLQKLDWGVKVLGSLDACHRVAMENVADAARAGIDYTELRFSPEYMAMHQQLPLHGVVEAVIDGIRAGCQQYGTEVRLTGIMSRTFGPEACQRELDSFLAFRDKITAVDLAGDELNFPGSEFTGHFRQARDAGFYITVHAGESAGAESIWQAINYLSAQRIGHGVKAITDRVLMDQLAERQIGIESCLTSNLQTSTIKYLNQHPLRDFLAHGILATICTDDPAVEGIDLPYEYEVAAPEAGLSPAEIHMAQENGLKIAFLSNTEKAELCKRKAMRYQQEKYTADNQGRHYQKHIS